MATKAVGNGKGKPEIINGAFSLVCQIFGIESLKPYQKQSMVALSKGEDCFLCQPTGSAKSIVFQALPFFVYAKAVLSYKEDVTFQMILENCKSKVLVVSPLLSLIRDQENTLIKKKIKVTSLMTTSVSSVEQLHEELENCQILFCSPESILTKYRQILKSPSFGRALIGIAIDESHCVKKWGSSSNQVEAFRSYYSKLSELRSLTFQKVPLLALTATATKATRDFIIDNLCLYNPVLLSATPERTNIRYSVVRISLRDPKTFLKPIFEDIKLNLYSAKRVLIFCRLMGDVRRIYQCFHKTFKNRFHSYNSDRPFARYHSKTDDVVKEFLLSDFTNENGIVRVLIATIAFGMGVDCKGLHTVIHYGPPGTLEDYFQEAGRAGRDGLPSEAVLVTYPKSLNPKNISKAVKLYSKNEEVCRRMLLLKEFGEEKQSLDPMHACCDICAKVCNCEGGAFKEKSKENWWETDAASSAPVVEKHFVISEEAAKYLRENLLKIREKIVKFQGHCGPAVNSGFPLAAIEEIISIAKPDVTRLDLMKGTSILNDQVYSDVIKVIKDTWLKFLPVGNLVSLSSHVSESEDEDDGSERDSDENKLGSNRYHATLVSSSDSDFYCFYCFGLIFTESII